MYQEVSGRQSRAGSQDYRHFLDGGAGRAKLPECYLDVELRPASVIDYTESGGSGKVLP